MLPAIWRSVLEKEKSSVRHHMESWGHRDPSGVWLWSWLFGFLSRWPRERSPHSLSVPSLSEILPSVSLQTFDPHGQSKKKIDRRFIFHKKEIRDKVEFESAMYPNWYISTSQADQTPVFLGSTKGGQDITDFTMEILTHWRDLYLYCHPEGCRKGTEGFEHGRGLHFTVV